MNNQTMSYDLNSIITEYKNLITKMIEIQKTRKNFLDVSKTIATGTIKFTKEEILHINPIFKKEFIANGLVAHVTKRENGKNSYYYEIRYRSNRFNFSASSTSLKDAKQKFIKKTFNI